MRALAVLALSLSVSLAPSAASAAPGERVPTWLPGLEVTGAFSPNGDGRAERATVRITLPAATSAQVTVRRTDRRKVVRRVRFDQVAAGTYRWRWDGRDGRGRRVPDGTYVVRVVAEGRSVDADTRVDTSAHAAVRVDRPVAPRVFPRSTRVRDALSLRVSTEERVLARARLVVRDASGRRVLQHTRRGLDQDWVVRWHARRQGRALPPGTYRAVVHATDRLGNRDRSRPLAIAVSKRRLVWREETRVLPATSSRVGPCAFTTANGCPDWLPYGEVVPSERYPDGLSFRSATGAEPTLGYAVQHYYLTVPHTARLRGVHSARVAFAGSPTVDGEDDPGRLSVWTDGSPSQVTSASGAGTLWVTDLAYGWGARPDGYLPRRDPGVVWSFSTQGTDSFDVESFTVDLRYLVVAPR